MRHEIDVEVKALRFSFATDIVFAVRKASDGSETKLKMNIAHQDLGMPPFAGGDDGHSPAPYKYIKPIPVVLYFTGGGFMMTDNIRKFPVLSYFLSRGYAVAMAEYRTGELGRYPRSVLDAQEAVSYLRAHAKEYAIDGDRIAVMGDSAGAYLALMAGYSCKGVRAVCDLYGLTDLNAMRDEELVRTYLGLENEENVERKCDAASPISHICDETPATIILHGDIDPAVPVEQSDALHDELEQSGIPVVYYRVHGAGHIDEKFDQPEMLSRIADFFDEYVRDSGDPEYDDAYLVMQ